MTLEIFVACDKTQHQSNENKHKKVEKHFLPPTCQGRVLPLLIGYFTLNARRNIDVVHAVEVVVNKEL